jgi:outer membrane protein assembly factor BamB
MAGPVNRRACPSPRRRSLIATAAAVLVVAAQPAASRADWGTYHGNGARTGYAKEGPRPEDVHRKWTRPVDGAVYAEPLVVGRHVLVATQNNSLYSFDAVHGKRRWRRHLGAPVPVATIDAPLAPGCGNIDPTGITSTPVVDRSAGLVFAVALLDHPVRHVLVAVDLRTGRVRWKRSIDPPGADPRIHQQRSALALSHHRVYVAYGGLAGDCGDYHGWVLGARTSGHGKLLTWRATVHKQAGIWAPSGPAVGADGSLYIATGNSDSSTFDYGDSVIRLTPKLQTVDYFAPTENGQLNKSDQDLGSVGPMLLPNSRAFIVGKSGIGYLLDPMHLGGIGHPIYQQDLQHDSYGGLAFARGLVYVPFRQAGTQALRLDGDRFSIAWRGPIFRSGPPIVAGSAVWTIDLDAGILYALDRLTGAVRFHTTIGEPAQFSTPTAANRRVYVASAKRILAFGDR